MHVARVSFAEVADPDDESSQVIVVQCLMQQFKPDDKVQVGQEVTLYDIKMGVEAPGVVHHINGDVAEVVVQRSDVKHLKVVNDGLTETQPMVIKYPWHRRSLHGVLATLLSVLFAVLFIQNYEVISASFIIQASGLGSLTNSILEDNGLSPMMVSTSWAWLVLWIPILALIVANLHWRADGDVVSGLLGTLASSVTAVVSLIFATFWLVLHGLVPLSFLEWIDTAPYAGPVALGIGFVLCFALTLTGRPAQHRRRKR